MDAYLDHLLDELITVEPREEWRDVLARAGRSRRRYLAALVVAAALLLAPAAWAVARAFEGKPAPQSIKSNLRESNKMTAQMAKALRRQNPAAAKRLRRQPKAIVSKTHGVIQVQTADGPLDLWAAPATDGGTCYFVGWQSDLHKTQAAGNSSCAPATASLSNKGSSAHSLDLSTWGDYQHRNYNIIQGYALRRRHDRPRGALKRQHPDAARSRRPIPRRVETERALATTSKDRLGDLAQRARPPRWLLEATTPIDRLYERTSEQSRSAEDVGALTSALPDSDLIGQPIDSLAVTKPLPYRLVSLATFAVAAAWLACACYALADLVSH